MAHIYLEEIPKGISAKMDDLVSKIDLFVQHAEQQAGIIEQHKGQVGVESRFGEGSTFWFTLPLL